MPTSDCIFTFTVTDTYTSDTAPTAPITVLTTTPSPASCYIYCVSFDPAGDLVSGAGYAPLTSSDVGTWKHTKGYYAISGGGTYLIGTDCVTANGYIYCVGGSNPNNDNLPTDSVYYAPITSSGVGTWTAATNTYPLDVNGGVTSSPYGSTTNTQCYSTNGYIYCVDLPVVVPCWVPVRRSHQFWCWRLDFNQGLL